MPKPPCRFDPLLPLALGAFALAGSRWAELAQLQDPATDRVPLDLMGYALLLAGPAALAVRRRYPAAVLAVNIAVTVLYVWLGYPYGPVFCSLGVAIFAAILGGRRRVAWAGSGLLFLFFTAYGSWVVPDPLGWLHHVGVAAMIGVVVTAAEVMRATRERRTEHRRAAEEESRRQVTEERLFMAQELHDVLAHNISLIHVQASTALHLIDDRPEQARTALATIKQASKDVLTEMRSVLDVLRDGAPRSPAAGLDRLGELVERVGTGVVTRIDGEVRPLPAPVDRAAYRIVQESLTNVTKHAPGSTARILLEYGPRSLLVRIDDDGADRPGTLAAQGGGNGLPGMRERATALGGTLTAGPRPDGGFRVEARLPIPALPERTPLTPEDAS